MPSYSYICNEHGNWVVDKKMSEAGEQEFCPTCNKVGRRDYSTINIDRTVEIRDPKHARYWKNNRSGTHVANSIMGDSDPY